MGAYSIPEPRFPRRRRDIPRCSACDGVVEAWAIPLDPRVPALCNACQQANQTGFRSIHQSEEDDQ